MEIFRLFGSIFIENEKANKSLRDTEKQATDVGKTLQETTKAAIKFGDELGKRLTDVGSKMTKLAGIPLAALKAAMFGLAKTTADYGDRVAKASQEIGLSVEAYQELEYALGQNGVATEQFEMAIGNLNRRLGEARRGNAKYRETLKQMGFSLDDLDKGAVTTEESFMQIVEALSQMDDAQMQASLASEFFGNRVAGKLMPAIRGGSEAIEELRKRAHDLGIVMDEEAARKSELFGDTMDDLGRAMGGFSRTIGSELQAPLINIAKWFTDIVAGASKWIEENPKLVRQVVMFGGAIAGVLGVLVTLGTTMIVTGKIIGALGAIFNILT
ncbi:MAG TPA: phage tail tape measure protein, partial [Limnochordia bacterium]|nr:phage tail tape measure protein [Limnochordia bacterium]